MAVNRRMSQATKAATMTEKRTTPNTEIAEKLRQDLIAYLSRVQGLPQPSRDLIFLHSEVGVATGIEAAIGDRLAEMARNGQTDGLSDLLADQSEAVEEAVVSNLARWTDSFALLPERENALKVLIAASAIAGQIGPETTALAAGAILGAPGQLPDGALADAVRFAQKCGVTQRRQLLAKLQKRKDLWSDPGTRVALIAGFDGLEENSDLGAGAFSVAVRSRDQEALEAFISLSEASRDRLLAGATGRILKWAEEDFAAEQGEAAQAEGEAESERAPSQVIGRLTFALDVLQDSKPAATLFAHCLLSLGDPDADWEVAHRFPIIAPIEDPDTVDLLLARTGERPIAERAAWLNAALPNSLSAAQIAHLSALASKEWAELASADVVNPEHEEILKALAAMAALADEPPPLLPDLEAVIEAALAGPMHDDAIGAERVRLSGLVERFIAAGLAAQGANADRFIDSCASAMEVLSPGELDSLPGLREAVRTLLAFWIDRASPEALQRLRDVARQNPDVALDPTKAQALISAVGQRNMIGEDHEVPLGATEVGALLPAYGDGAEGALLSWLRYFGSEEPIWPLLESTWRQVLPSAVRAQCDQTVRKLEPHDRAQLTEAAIANSLDHGLPPAENWEAIALRDVKAGQIIETLAERAPENVDDIERWRRILEVCRQRAPGSNSRARVAELLLEPLLQSGSDEAFALALDHLELIGKKNTESLFAEIPLDANRQSQLNAKLSDLDWGKSTVSRILDSFRGNPS